MNVTLAAVVSVTALGALAAPPSHAAIPVPDPIGHVVTDTGPTSSPVGTAPDRPCFVWRARWNSALDGPEPTC
ncbi:hypothetical protein [Nocardioides sp. LS1]|uniref:hypothetical protein n=1 Tax=Nocardioides sp. LS1 TaxID=1027620 RepID=UPI000F616ACD|nr:hypothetical protein [Nocardioides sp. LS1]GCD89925.1 hypothetical protein NLS1_19310 [Nocardioides sp. LS1]